MPRPPALPAEEKVTLVLAILAGEMTAAQAARTAGVSDQAICNWKRRFITAGRLGLESAPDHSSHREQQLLAEVAELKSALGESYLQLKRLTEIARAACPRPVRAAQEQQNLPDAGRRRPAPRGPQPSGTGSYA
ncbi:helix-turn-helix domain-containing protein [Streptomyces sp. TS71-3]|uniref:helix-turn-helix domain-containing protein n=1 Tax=Streptomyces sp. TS71-3 TaxID=2733862 RepID=UPI001B28EAC2|nr:helix-turn-helix domain-containing protein [Streptomyces sp. TS71-3]GHJ36766.1 hypothetical protein Sm713_23750 [Streptomyces sp. TS71-3]